MPAKYAWSRENLSRIEHRAGLYTVYGFIPGHKMYHGKTNDLHRRLLEHYREEDIGFLPAYVVVTYVQNYLQRGARERERIRKDRPTYNVKLKPRSSFWG